MSTKMTRLVLALGAMAMAGGAMADGSATVAATATVLAPLAISVGQALDFGSFALKDQTAIGTVLIGVAADTATLSNTIATSVGNTTTKRGSVTLSGVALATYSIAVSSSATVAAAGEAPRVTIDVAFLELKNTGAAMKESIGTFWTIIQGPGSSSAIAA